MQTRAQVRFSCWVIGYTRDTGLETSRDYAVRQFQLLGDWLYS